MREPKDTLSGTDLPDETESPTSPVWDRQAGENDTDHALFLDWIQAGAPPLDGWAREVGRTRGYLVRLSARYRWQARRAALSHHLVTVRVQAAEAEARDLGASLARLYAEVSEWALTSALEARARGERLTPREIVAMADLVSKQHALIQGKPTEIIDLSARSTAELEAMDALLNGDVDAAKKALDLKN